MKRVIIPDSHGQYIDKGAEDAAIAILKHVKPTEVVLLGDHVDCGGMYSRFDRLGINDIYFSKIDFKAAQTFMERVRSTVGRSASILYLEGNHEQHIERWACKQLREQDDIDLYLASGSVPKRLTLDKLRITYYRRDEFHHGMSSPGVIKLDGCLFTHGLSAALYATARHLAAYSENIVHGHTHRAASHVGRLATGRIIQAHCPGTLARLQQLYQHSAVSQHTHGVAYQEVSGGELYHFNVGIRNGKWKLP